jgi:hypothetical protein
MSTLLTSFDFTSQMRAAAVGERDVDGVSFGVQLADDGWSPDRIQDAQAEVIKELRAEHGNPLPEKMRLAVQTFLNTTFAGFSHPFCPIKRMAVRRFPSTVIRYSNHSLN